MAYGDLEELVIYLLGSSSEENMKIFEAKSAKGVFNTLMKRHSLKQIIIRLNDAVPRVIKDVPEV